MMGRGGKVRTGLPCLDEAKEIFTKNKVSSIIAGAELYCQKKGKRSRVYDVIAALSDKKLIKTIGLAFFDILEIDEESMKSESYETIFKKLKKVLPEDGLAHIIETKKAKNKNEVNSIFKDWVETKGEEGLVVRGDMPFMYKIKPKHTFDVVVIGYTEGINEHKGKVKALLFAFLREDGIYQIAGKVGNMNEDERQNFFDTLSTKHVESTYIESDNDGIAFHMVKPEIIIEVGCNDLMIENTYGKALLNHLVTFDNDSYSFYHSIPGVRFLFPVLERIRDDKTNIYEDIKFSQITDLIYLPEKDIKPETLPKSEIILREVYTKASKKKTMVQKFLVWKTNKHDVDARHPAYVMFYTNFSPNRKDPLNTEIRISNTESQIMKITENFISENVKKGWKKNE